MDLKSFVEQSLNEMALRTDLIDLNVVKNTLSKLESAGIKLEDYTFSEIQMAFFLLFDQIIVPQAEETGDAEDDRSAVINHQVKVMELWKPSMKGSESTATGNYRGIRNNFADLMKSGAESFGSVVGPDGKKHTISRYDVVQARKMNVGLGHGERIGTVKKKETEVEED